MTEIIYKKESYAIIGACFEVYTAHQNQSGSIRCFSLIYSRQFA